jgi:uncharacterized membrane protein (DUF485 family)
MIGKKTLGEKIISNLLVLFMFSIYVVVPCGIAWLIGLIPNVSINYLIPVGIGLFAFVFHLLIGVYQVMQFKKVKSEMEKEFKMDWKL